MAFLVEWKGECNERVILRQEIFCSTQSDAKLAVCDDQEGTGKDLERGLQPLHGRQVQVVCGFIQYEKPDSATEPHGDTQASGFTGRGLTRGQESLRDPHSTRPGRERCPLRTSRHWQPQSPSNRCRLTPKSRGMVYPYESARERVNLVPVKWTGQSSRTG